METLHNEVAVTNASLLCPCPTAAARLCCSIASTGSLSMLSSATPNSASQSPHLSATLSLGTAVTQRPMPPIQHTASGAKTTLPRGLWGQFVCILVAKMRWPGSVVADVASDQQQGSGYWAHPAVGDAGVHAVGAGLGLQKGLLLPVHVGCYAPALELHGEAWPVNDTCPVHEPMPESGSAGSKLAMHGRQHLGVLLANPGEPSRAMQTPQDAPGSAECSNKVTSRKSG